MRTIRLNNGVEIPQEGFGVFQMTDLKVCEQAVLDALHLGYRLLDTASSYKNEEAVGLAVKKAALAGRIYLLRQRLTFRKWGMKTQRKHLRIPVKSWGQIIWIYI